MTEITIVVNKRTRKLLKFSYATNGEITLYNDSDHMNPDDIIVTKTDMRFLDLENGYLLDKPRYEKMEEHPAKFMGGGDF